MAVLRSCKGCVLVAALVLLVAAGCGGPGGSGGTSGGSAVLNIQVGIGGGMQEEVPSSCNRIGPDQSLAIQTVQLAIESPSGDYDCCIAFDPCGNSFRHERRIVIALPDPPGGEDLISVGVAAFAEDEAPFLGSELPRVCRTSPRGNGFACAPPRCDAFPSYLGRASEVLIVAKHQTDVAIDPLPQLVLKDMNPPCGSAIVVPETIDLLALAPVSLSPFGTIDIVQEGVGRQCYFLRDSEPDRISVDPGLAGFAASAVAGSCENRDPPLQVGPANVVVQWATAGDPNDLLVATYPIEILASPTPSPSQTATQSPSLTPSLSPTPTVTPTRTFTPGSPVIP